MEVPIFKNTVELLISFIASKVKVNTKNLKIYKNSLKFLDKIARDSFRNILSNIVLPSHIVSDLIITVLYMFQ